MIHSTADVSTEAKIGSGTRVWHEAQIREGAVVVGSRVKIQNRASLFRGLTVEDNVYIGPHVSFANDRYPRAVNAHGSSKTDDDWELEPTLVREGASLGAGAIILPGLTIGRWAMVGAGAVVTRDVPDQALVVGNPARLAGYACTCGRTLEQDGDTYRCAACDATFKFESTKASAR